MNKRKRYNHSSQVVILYSTKRRQWWLNAYDQNSSTAVVVGMRKCNEFAKELVANYGTQSSGCLESYLSSVTEPEGMHDISY